MYKKIINQNKRATFEYFIEERIEAGIVLKGTEVKAIREGKVNIQDSHAQDSGGEIFLLNSYVGEYVQANRFNHDTRRPRKLLLRSKEIKKIVGKIRVKGYTLVALSIFFNEKNIIKVELGIAKGKKLHDKRETIKTKDWEREQGRLLRNRG